MARHQDSRQHAGTVASHIEMPQLFSRDINGTQAFWIRTKPAYPKRLMHLAPLRLLCAPDGMIRSALMFSQPLRQTRQSDRCIDLRLQSVALMRNDCVLSDTDRTVGSLMATMNLEIPGDTMIAIPPTRP